MEFKVLLLKTFLFIVTLLAVLRGLVIRSRKTAKKAQGINLAAGYRHVSSYPGMKAHGASSSRAPLAKVISLAAHRKRVS